MGIIALTSVAQNPLTMDSIFQAGELATISLILTLTISLLIIDTEYEKNFATSSIDACTYSFLITFIAIFIFRIILVL